MFSEITLYCILVLPGYITSAHLSSYDLQQLLKYHIIPDIISEAPYERVNVTYRENLAVDMGNELTSIQVHEPPTKISYPVQEGAYYTLLLTDLDIPASIGSTLQHLLICNIPGDETDMGETVWQYIGASPPQGSGIHRYIYQVYQQQGILTPSEFAALTDEKKGKVTTRINNSVMTVRQILRIGNPTAVNFFRTQFDEHSEKYLEEVYAKYN